jgi:hypothetical protein
MKRHINDRMDEIECCFDEHLAAVDENARVDRIRFRIVLALFTLNAAALLGMELLRW